MSIWNLSLVGLLMISSCANNNRGKYLPLNDAAAIQLFEILGSEQTGIHFENRLTEDVDHNSFNDVYFYNGSGVSVADFNNDGLMDLYFVSAQRGNAMYLNRGALVFEDISEISGTADSVGFQTGVTAVDINADGWMDLYLSVAGIHQKKEFRKNRLYINLGPGEDGVPVFEDRAAEYGLDIDMFSTQAAFFDYDLDGDLDMALANHHQVDYPFQELEAYLKQESDVTGDRLYENRDGRYVDVSREAGLINSTLRCILGIAVSDVNNDGWPDFYVSNDFTGKDELYLNNGDGTFTPEIHNSFEHISYASMGNELADINNDGWTDLVTMDMTASDNFSIKASMGSMNELLFHTLVDLGQHQQYMYNTLQLNRGRPDGSQTPHFSDVAQIAGVSSTDWSWGPLIFDMDNDGLKDLYVANGIKGDLINVDYLSYRSRMFANYSNGKMNQHEFLNGVLSQMPDRKKRDHFYRNNGQLDFEDMNDVWVDELLTCSNGTAYGDLDNDGDLDIVVNNSGGGSFIYKNNSREHNTGYFLQFKLKGPESNPLGIGARVILKGPDGEQMTEQYLSRGFQSSVSPVLHFGTGDKTTIPEVRIIWPDGSSQVLKQVKTNQVVELDHAKADLSFTYETRLAPQFSDVTDLLNVDHEHEENIFNDYERESLIPHRMSTLGPALAVGDVNQDGLDDFFVGGAIGKPGVLYLQDVDGFKSSGDQPWNSDRDFEDLGALFFDADGDADLDLYVASGGNEYDPGSPFLQDRFYLNNGKGEFKKVTSALPPVAISGLTVEGGDYDGDGDTDLFVGGRQQPGQYPVPASSHILRNDSRDGTIQFVDVTPELTGDFKDLGMVTDARWTDLEGSGSADLILTGEWMSIRIFRYSNGTFIDISDQAGLTTDVGWWNCVEVQDFDGDGDLDMVAGNLGLNYKYKATPDHPFEVYAKDFDNNGTYDIVLGYYDSETLYPVRGRTCSSNQMPFIKQKFPTYNEFGQATLADIYGIESLGTALNYKATNFASSYLENIGGGTFEISPLPAPAQISSVNGILSSDMDGDGNLDLVLGGNLFGSEAETPRNDASMGLFLKGHGDGSFTPVPALESGLYMGGDVKGIQFINLGEDKSLGIISARNSGRILLHQLN